jgi:hypothetical protein
MPQDSDVDIMVVLKGDVRPMTEIVRTGDIVSSISLDNDLVISCIFLTEERYLRADAPLIANVAEKGCLVTSPIEELVHKSPPTSGPGSLPRG